MEAVLVRLFTRSSCLFGAGFLQTRVSDAVFGSFSAMCDYFQHILYKYLFKYLKVFGAEGDFITAPELTQLFGEMIGIWCYHELGFTG